MHTPFNKIFNFSLLVILVAVTSYGCKKQELAFQNFVQQGVSLRVVDPAEKPVAKIYDFSGQVSVKFNGESNWQRVSEKCDLYSGDSVFAHEKSALRIEYYGAGATLQLREFSFFIVGKNPLGYSRFKRKSGYGNTSLSISKSSGDNFTIAKPSDNKSGTIAAPRDELGIEMQRDVTRIPVLEPVGNVTLFSKEFPAFLTLKFENTWDGIGLWCFVWASAADSSTPVWVGFNRGSFKEIPIPKPGDYMVQIITEDETRTTRPIFVSAKKRTPAFPQLFSLLSKLKQNPQPVTVELQ